MAALIEVEQLLASRRAPVAVTLRRLLAERIESIRRMQASEASPISELAGRIADIDRSA